MRRRRPISHEVESGLWIAGIMVFVIALIWVLWWILSTRSAEAQSCEDQGGHMYSRQVGKVKHYKCVTDDNKVIVL